MFKHKCFVDNGEEQRQKKKDVLSSNSCLQS